MTAQDIEWALLAAIVGDTDMSYFIITDDDESTTPFDDNVVKFHDRASAEKMLAMLQSLEGLLVGSYVREVRPQ